MGAIIDLSVALKPDLCPTCGRASCELRDTAPRSIKECRWYSFDPGRAGDAVVKATIDEHGRVLSGFVGRGRVKLDALE